MICIKCEIEFDPSDKSRVAKLRGSKIGKVNECLDCADDPVVPFTGVMIYGHKTAGSIQINADPSLTEYMQKAGGWRRARSLGQTSKFSSLDSTKKGVHVEVRDVAKRRE